jgi:hypothetical protein
MKHGFREPAYIEHILLHDKTYGAELLPLYHKRLNEILRADKFFLICQRKNCHD